MSGEGRILEDRVDNEGVLARVVSFDLIAGRGHGGLAYMADDGATEPVFLENVGLTL